MTRRARKKPLAELRVFITAETSVVSARDTGDTGYFHRIYGQSDCRLSHFWFLCVAYRSLNKPRTWECVRSLMGGVPPTRRQGRPTLDWAKIQKALTKCAKDAAERGEGIMSDVYYPAVLREYRRTANAQWVSCQSESVERKVLLGLQCFWRAVPVQQLDDYEATPSREHFIKFYDTFRQRMADTTYGLYGPYMMKVGLDLLVVCRRVHTHHLARWPAECDGYTNSFRHVFGPEPLTQEFRMKALLWLHRQFGDACGGRLSFSDVAAQLCWFKRAGGAS